MSSELTWLDTLATLGVATALPLILIELVTFAWRGRLTGQRVREMLASYSTLLPSTVVQVAIQGSWLAAFVYLSSWSLFDVPITPVTAVLAVLLVDLTYYVEHRVAHRVRGLWAVSHSVHHSSPIYDQSTAFRISFVDQFLSPPFYLPLVLIGFDPLLVLVSLGLVIGYQGWLHTELVGKLGWLEYVFNTPSHHRVHHASDGPYLDKNFGGILIVWDRLFGTFAREEAAPTYGLTKPIASTNPLWVHFEGARRLWRDIRAAPNIVEALRVVARPPG